jgi:2-dehydro-3-deoxyglucarate aldolase/4-hydroxy-2-oxoheptanedioate aldolase
MTRSTRYAAVSAMRLACTAQDLGVFGKPEMHKMLDERRDTILAAAKKHGTTCAMLVGSQDEAQQWQEAGVLLLVYKSEVEILANGYRDALKPIRG